MNMQTTTTTNASPDKFSSPSAELVSLIQKHSQDIPEHLDHPATLDLICLKYLHLYDAWMVEHQHTGSHAAQLKDLIKVFDAQVRAFASFEDKIRQNLIDMVRRSVTGGILEVSERILNDTTEGAKKVTHELRTEVNHAKHELAYYKSYLSKQHIKTILIGAAMAVVVAIALGKWLMPAPLTAAAARDIEIGQSIDNLSYNQKARIQQIMDESQANKT